MELKDFEPMPAKRRVPWTPMLTAFGRSSERALHFECDTVQEAANRARAATICTRRKKLPLKVTRRGAEFWIEKVETWTG